MPLNYLDVQFQIPRFVKTHHQALTRRESLLGFAQNLLKQAAEQPQQINQIISDEKHDNNKLRCAGPFQENMASANALDTIKTIPWRLIGVDGSQIAPDPHSALPFGLVNTGVFEMHTEANQLPQQQTISNLIYDIGQDNLMSLPSEEEINLVRDLEEREVLVKLAATSQEAIIALTDGPLGLFREPEKNSPWLTRFTELMQLYMQLPSPIRIIAGYVDRPRSNLVIQMLEMWLKKLPLRTNDQPASLEGLRDEDLFRTILPAGSRSAVFVLHSHSARFFQDELAIHFYYLNVGQVDKPALVRIEIPAWVAKKPGLLDALHQQLLDQCQMLGSRPYPYILHRAHEVAVVHQDEKSGLESMMIKHWLDSGLPFPDISNKQFLKNLTGSRRRFG